MFLAAKPPGCGNHALLIVRRSPETSHQRPTRWLSRECSGKSAVHTAGKTIQTHRVLSAANDQPIQYRKRCYLPLKQGIGWAFACLTIDLQVLHLRRLTV